MNKIKVLFHGSCWPTNIGNAFVNLGTIQAIKSALRNRGDVYHIGGMSGYLFNTKGKLDFSLPIGKLIDCDYLVNAGMTMCNDHIVANVPIYQQFVKRGTKIIFVGAGAGKYTDDEVNAVRKAMTKFPIYGMISRDRYTFKKYNDLVENSYDGIDSALFIGDFFNPVPLNLPEFDVMTFDSLKEPKVNHEGRTVIRTHHTCWPPYLQKRYFDQKNTLISDLPSDYLTLYSQAKITDSDRVHACLPTLAFGELAKMYFKKGDKRHPIFQRLGVPQIENKLVSLESEWLAKEKKDQIDFLSSIL